MSNTVLDQLFAKSTVTLPTLGKEVVIKKATLRTMKPILDVLGKVMDDLKVTSSNIPDIDLNSPAVLLKLISKYLDEVLEIVVLHSSIDKDEFLDMSSDESVLIVQAVIALNKDFFTKKVLPNLQLLNVGPDA